MNIKQLLLVGLVGFMSFSVLGQCGKDYKLGDFSLVADCSAGESVSALHIFGLTQAKEVHFPVNYELKTSEGKVVKRGTIKKNTKDKSFKKVLVEIPNLKAGKYALFICDTKDKTYAKQIISIITK